MGLRTTIYENLGTPLYKTPNGKERFFEVYIRFNPYDKFGPYSVFDLDVLLGGGFNLISLHWATARPYLASSAAEIIFLTRKIRLRH